MSYLCKFATSRAPAASQITFSSSVVFLFQFVQFMHMFNISCTCGNLICVFSVFFYMSHFKVQENEIVGGGIGCQIQSLQFYPSHFLPQNSGKNVIVGAGVSYLCKITSRAPGASQTTFSSFVVFLFPPQNSRKCRCGVLVVGSIHAHVQHLMHLRQSDLHVSVLIFHVPLQGSGK